MQIEVQHPTSVTHLMGPMTKSRSDIQLQDLGKLKFESTDILYSSCYPTKLQLNSAVCKCLITAHHYAFEVHLSACC